MKKLLFCVFVLLPQIACADDSIQSQMLDAQIEKLEQEYSEKLTALQKCEQETKGFKIAGITTLSLTGVGIYASVKLAEKLKKASNGASGGGNGGPVSPTDNRSQSDKDCESVKSLFDEGLATQQEVDETCGNN